MFSFAVLIAICAIFIYILERRLRHSIQNQNLSPFDEKLVKKASAIAQLCKNKAWCSNSVLVIGLIFSFGFFSIDVMLYQWGFKVSLEGAYQIV